MADAPAATAAATAILIVEAHHAVRAALCDWMRTLFPEYQVLEARSGEEAVSITAVRQPAVVVMGISQPGISGIEATRVIKRVLPLVQVIILTSHDEALYQAEARSAGANAYVLKREAFTELVPALQRLLPRAKPEAAGAAGSSR